MMSLEKQPIEMRSLKPVSLFGLLLHTGMRKDRIALKADVIGPESIVFAGASVHHSAQKFYRLGQ